MSHSCFAVWYIFPNLVLKQVKNHCRTERRRRWRNHAHGTNHRASVRLSSPDYDAVLTETGRYTEKYNITKELLQQYSVVKNIRAVEAPPENPVSAFEPVQMTESLSLEGVRSQLTSQLSDTLLSMEELDTNGGSGQSYGLVWYRATITTRADSEITIRGHVRSDHHPRTRQVRSPSAATDQVRLRSPPAPHWGSVPGSHGTRGSQVKVCQTEVRSDARRTRVLSRSRRGLLANLGV